VVLAYSIYILIFYSELQPAFGGKFIVTCVHLKITQTTEEGNDCFISCFIMLGYEVLNEILHNVYE
jgi:hypothetical protein